MALALAAMMLLLITLKTNTILTTTKQTLVQWWSVYQTVWTSDLYQTASAMHCIETACSMSIVLVAFFIVVVMVSFIAVKLQGEVHVNSLYQHQYLYTITSAFFIGTTPTVMIWVYVTLAGLIVILLCVSTRPILAKAKVTKKSATHRINSNEEDSVVLEYKETIRSIAIRFSVELVVIAMALANNYGFVYLIYFEQPSQLTLVQMTFAAVKAFFLGTIVPYTSLLVPKSSRQIHYVVMTIMVNIIGPGVAVLLTSPLCLYNKREPSGISVNYVYPIFNLNADGVLEETATTVYSDITPQWFYSYECSSSFLTSYLPTFIYLYIINGIISPLYYLATMLLLSTSNEGFIKRMRTLLLFTEGLKINRIFFITNSTSSPQIEMSARSDNESNDGATTTSNATIIGTSRSAINISNKYEFDVYDLMPTVCVDIVMLMTLGLASPLLAVLILMSIATNLFLWRLAVGRYIEIVSKAIGTVACHELLEMGFRDEWQCLKRSWAIISTLVGMFWSTFVFDMIGDKDYYRGGAAGLTMLLWCPSVFISVQQLLAVDVDVAAGTRKGVIGSIISSIRHSSHVLASLVHDNIWIYVIRLRKGVGAITADDDDDERLSTVTETVSPLNRSTVNDSQK